MIVLLAIVLTFLITYTAIGTKYQWVQASRAIDQTIREANSANYVTIARLEQGIWDGNSFHNGLPRDNDQSCECNTICHPDTFYVPVVQPPPKAPEEWRDREGP